MLGLGVAFSAIPFLGLFMNDLVHQVHPLSLVLNGVTALLSALGFAKSGFVDWRKAINLSIITTVSISILSGFLGVGPGFLLMPTLIILGFEPKKAAGINAFAVCPPSFSALIPHLSTAHWNLNLTIGLVFVGAIFSFFGARTTSLFVLSVRVKQIFAILILIVTAYKLITILT